MFDELLSSEAGVYPHYQHHIQLTHDVLQQRHGRGGIDSDGRLHACVTYLLHHTVQVRADLIMHVHHVGAQGFHFGDELLGLDNHQMDIQRLVGQAGNVLQHRESERDIGHKDAVHNVQMDPVGIAAVQHIHLISQVSEVGRENRRGNNRFHIY